MPLLHICFFWETLSFCQHLMINWRNRQEDSDSDSRRNSDSFWKVTSSKRNAYVIRNQYLDNVNFEISKLNQSSFFTKYYLSLPKTRNLYLRWSFILWNNAGPIRLICLLILMRNTYVKGRTVRCLILLQEERYLYCMYFNRHVDCF